MEINMSENEVEVVDDSETPDIIDNFNNLPGIPKEKVDIWKDKYGTVFRIFFLEEQYIYRNFTYPEYKALRKKIREQYPDNVQEGDDAFKEEIQKLCVIWPEDYILRLTTGKPKPVPGGIPFLLGDYILAASGFADSIIPDIISKNNG
jgi:hypothetical protein